MTEQISDLSKFDLLISEKMNEAVLRRNAIWDFVGAEHSIKDAKAQLRDARVFGKEVSGILLTLNNHKRANPSDSKQVDALLQNFNTLNGYFLEIQECLTKDIDEKQKEADGKKIDFVKNVMFIFGLPGLFVTGVRNGIGHDHVDVDQAMVLGFAVSIPTVFHKTARSLFTKTVKSVCAVPSMIRDDMRIYYVKEIVKEKTNKARVCFETAAKSINDNMRTSGNRTRATLRRVLGGRSPRP